MKNLARKLRKLATDPRIPKPVRWLIIVGLLPIPGPVDEVFLGIAAILLLTCFRGIAKDVMNG